MTTTVLITGANKGIGRHTARLLGARGMTVLAGARDAGRGRQAEQELRANGADARFVQLDVTDEASARQAAKWIEAEFGMLDVLLRAPAGRIVNVSSEVGSITAMTDPGGPMAMMASVPYPSSKTALNMVTAMYAKELRDTKVKINAANPGYCATDLNGNSGFRTPEQGAEVSVHLATLPDDGPSGVLWGYVWTADGTESYGVLPW